MILMDLCSPLLGGRLAALIPGMRTCRYTGNSTICTGKVMMLAPIALWRLSITLYLEQLASPIVQG